MLGLDARMAELKAGFATARAARSVRGFAVGRTIFADAARGWLGGSLTDEAAVADMAAKYQRLCQLWDEARASAPADARKGAAA